MRRADQWILVFDSGLGGLSVLRELVQWLPHERYLYLGDSLHAPYGVRSTKEVKKLTFSAIQEHWGRGIKAIVVACNTATAAAIEELRWEYPKIIVIGMEPALKVAAERHPGGRILVMATPVTLQEQKFISLMDRFSDSCQIIPLPCPGLVEYVEAGQLDTPELRARLHELLDPVLAEGVDAIVLGCSHFPFLRPLIQEMTQYNIEILDGARGTAQHTRRRLQEEDLLRVYDGEIELHNSLGSPEILELSYALLTAPG